TYVQIETKEKNAQYIKWLQSKYGDYFVNMLVVGERDGERTYQFKLADSIENIDEVALKMFIEVPGLYAQEHGGRLVFDTEEAKTLDAQYYPLFTSSNISGPGKVEDDSETPGKDDEDETPGKDEKPGEDEESGKDEDDEKPGKGDFSNELEAYSINYTILHAKENEVSIANRYFSGKATLI